MTWGLVQLPGKEREYSVYATEAYYTGPDSRVRRFTYRVDGFVSLRGESEGGSLVTKPLVFEGSELRLNFVASDRGDVRVELQDANGVVIEGFAVSDCVPLRGDSIDEVVTWRGRDVSTLAGTAVRVRFEVKNSDVYSFRFK